MHWGNHFLFTFNILYLIFRNSQITINEIIIFTIIFGILVDFDFIIRRYIFKNKNKYVRTFIQEPLGIVLVGLPIGIILSFLNKEYLLLTIIPYTCHIVLDYLAIHKVFPLAPFSKKIIKVGIIKPVRLPLKNFLNFKDINENWFLIINIIITTILFIK